MRLLAELSESRTADAIACLGLIARSDPAGEWYLDSRREDIRSILANGRASESSDVRDASELLLNDLALAGHPDLLSDQ